MTVDFYLVNDTYLSYLNGFDNRVSMNHGASARPFVAVLASCLGKDFLIPLTHYVKKKNLGNLPLRIIGATNAEELGTLLINNMIPYRPDVVTNLIINTITDVKYQNLLRKQWSILRDLDFQERLEREVKKAYYFQTNSKNITNPIHSIFVDYLLLESASSSYIAP
ncbi:MAG: type III toxin-antitoxin system ToxN/AbiQ family toxin [Candidatus Izemoplasmataceae bacterium]